MEHPLNKNSNTQGGFPYISFTSVIFVFGMLGGYLLLDIHAQIKADMSIIQIINTISKLNNEKKSQDVNSTITVYKLYINGLEHNFSFENFKFENLKLDGITLDHIKKERNK